ncbi:MAG: glycolate oxidase subunit GlcE [Gemmatimonadota bacterium]
MTTHSLHRVAQVGEVADAIRTAAEHQTPLRFRGTGTWMHGGGPFAEATVLDLSGLSHVIEYIPGDLVITVGAGMPLSTLRAITAEHGQMFALDPYGDATGSIGACVATASAAPLAPSDLQMRDLVLGIEAVLGTGEITRAGGRVVKNVAGFDLVRLHTGAWGTLGALTTVSLRLHARPAIDVAVTGTAPIAVDDPAFSTWLDPIVANRAPLPMLVVIAPNAQPRLVARVSGNRARVAALMTRVQAFGVGPLQEHAIEATLETLRVTTPDVAMLRLRASLRDAARFVHHVRRTLPEATLLYDPARGALRVLTRQDATDALASVMATGGASYIRGVIDQGRRTVPTPSALEGQIKRALDPSDLCNRLMHHVTLPWDHARAISEPGAV